MATQCSEILKRSPVEPRWDREFGLDLTKQLKWNIPDMVVIEAAVVGHSIKRTTNPHHPYTPYEIMSVLGNYISYDKGGRIWFI